MSVANIKPWFAIDLQRVLSSIYITGITSRGNPMSEEEKQEHLGFISGLSAFAMFVGVNPASFLSPQDVARIKERINP